MLSQNVWNICEQVKVAYFDYENGKRVFLGTRVVVFWQNQPPPSNQIHLKKRYF